MNIFGKRLSRAVHRQAITVVLVAVAAVVGPTLLLLLLTGLDLDRVLFEAVSAFAPSASRRHHARPARRGEGRARLLMLLGRLGPLTLGTAIALRDRRILYEFPKERPAIG